MSMNTYPVQTSMVLYINHLVLPFIMLKRDMEDNELPVGVQALLDTGKFSDAVYEPIHLDDFKAEHPEYADLDELIPDYYYDVAEAYDFITDTDTGCTFLCQTEGEICTVNPEEVEHPIEETVNCDDVIYLTPYRNASHFKAAYSSMNEVVKEFKERLDGILPENVRPKCFDIRTHICSIDGTYYC